ncbi:hypothetical protein BV898_03020 [Hypsibius exemplaris]|uniref:Gustatory receptor n=1 Tax=Hypsibius exemplaris TaxID=2072580 RepID=A0A1W0X628_HYPEX|nr:hypothetical protein BV898_03020 [Hypsibius exemplaris]
MFSLDFGDWVVNGEAALHLQQTRIISMLTYLDSQFGLWLGMATTFVFIAKADKMIYCVQSLGKSMSHFGMASAENHRRRKVALAWVLITALALFSLFRGIYGIWEAAGSPSTFWTPRSYFLWQVPSGIVAIILRTFFFISEVSALPIYVVFIFVCAKFTDCFEALTAEIRTLLDDLQARTLDGPLFLTKLKTLSLKEVTLTQALIDLDQCFALQVLFFVIDNSLGVFSKIAKCFVYSAFTSDMDYVKFALKGFMYVAALGLTTVFPAILHESSARSITLWQRLIAVRQEQRETYCPEEGEVLITLLQRTTARQHSLTVAGIATLTRSFGVTLLLGFAGFTCFLIDRAENYRMDDELSENITCACLG